MLSIRRTQIISKLLTAFLICAVSCAGTKDPLPASSSQLKEKRLQPGLNHQVVIYYEKAAWKKYLPQIEYALHRAVAKFERYLKPRAGLAPELVLMNEDFFKRKITDAHWVTAVYHKGRIFIPVPAHAGIDKERIIHTIAHEYSHAIIDDLTDGNAPAWLDEGIALVVEGSPQHSATGLFFDWLRYKKPIPLESLESGFTRHDRETAKHAYIQSRETVQFLINNYGTEKLQALLEHLRTGRSLPESFQDIYALSFSSFQRTVAKTLKAKSKQLARKEVS